MKKYVVAFINFHDNDLKVYFVEAESEHDAIGKTEIVAQGWAHDEIPKDLSELKDYFFNCDAVIEVKELPQ